jgi:hypothetical protein
MGDLLVVKDKGRYDVPEPLDARKKWVEAQMQEIKSRMFAAKQELDKCDQEIDDIRNGKMKRLQYNLIMLAETLKKYNEELNEVIIS